MGFRCKSECDYSVSLSVSLAIRRSRSFTCSTWRMFCHWVHCLVSRDLITNPKIVLVPHEQKICCRASIWRKGSKKVMFHTHRSSSSFCPPPRQNIKRQTQILSSPLQIAQHFPSQTLTVFVHTFFKTRFVHKS